ncbi:MAG: sigma-70 family RNA polymerase sigma factor [Clostridia bacterium]|nr:sigma-70 family RNA polymerase sigma factor [Clostridia bacterium]
MKLAVNETDLIKKCQAGDSAAFDVLIDMYASRAYAVAFGVMGNQHDASDMVQDAFIKVYKNIKKFNFQSSFNTWLHRIVKNTCIDELRKRGKGTVVSLDAALDSGDGEYLVQIADDAPGIQEILEKQEESGMLWEALGELNEAHRLVLVLADIKGYEYVEVAAMAGIPVGTVKSRISRARTKLAEIIREKGTI